MPQKAFRKINWRLLDRSTGITAGPYHGSIGDVPFAEFEETFYAEN